MNARTLTLIIAAWLVVPAFLTAASNRKSARLEVTGELEQAIKKVYPALVRISVVSETGEAGRMRKSRSSGSGTIISEDGYILTNHHVAGRATRLTCRLADREEVEAELVGTDALSDLAVLKLKLSTRRNPTVPLPFAKFGNSDELKVGDTVLAMGSPSGLSQSVTKGIVANTAMIMPYSAGDLLLDGENVGELVRWIGHDAVIYHGNSGGPLVNLRGEIVGVNEVGIATMGGAIPGNLAQTVAKELIARGSVSRSWIGLEVEPLLKSMPEKLGILVAAVLPDSPAKAAGLEPGDIITNVNGMPVAESRAPEDVPVFNRLVLSVPVGSEIALKGLRGESPMTFKMRTLAREANLAFEKELTGWGITVRSFTRMSALENRRPDKKGAVVDTVRPGGSAEAAKPSLRPDDVITCVGSKAIEDAAGLIQITKDLTAGIKEPRPVLVEFEREAKQFNTVVKIGPEVQSDPPGRPARPWLGLDAQVLTRELAGALGLDGKQGVRITRVAPESPAGKAGLRAGDVILKLDGQVVAASTEADEELFRNLIIQYKVGAEIELSISRNGQPLTVSAKLGPEPKRASDLPEFKDELFQFGARDIVFADRQEEQFSSEVEGVRITSVERAGWAALAGLESGDILVKVDGNNIANIAELKGALSALAQKKPRHVTLFVKRGIRTRFLEAEPRW